METSGFSKELIKILSVQFNEQSFSCLSTGVSYLLCKVGVETSHSQNQNNDSFASNDHNFKEDLKPNDRDKPCVNEERKDDKIMQIKLTVPLTFSDIKVPMEFHTLFFIRGLIYFNEESSIRKRHDELDEIYFRSCYEECVKNMSPAFGFAELFLKNVSYEIFCERYGQYLDWTRNKKLFLECLKLLTHQDCVDDLLALLILCAGLEKALGNLYLTKGNKCTGLLKDLLVTSELRCILGNSIISILHVLLGPPLSLNLRNIAWHGFLSTDELPRRYIFFLLLLTISMGKYLEEKQFPVDLIKNQEYVPLSSCDAIALHLNKLTDDQLHLTEASIINSWVITSGNVKIIKAGFTHLRNHNYGWCALCFLPQLEFTMRRLFVAVNKSPDRLLTAESTTLYTTFEEILDCYLPDGSQNALVDVCGKSFMDLLHDLLVYPKGPRARDKLSHGEADYTTTPQSLCQILVHCLAFLAEKVKSSDGVYSVQNYESVFHPVSILKQKILELSFLSSDLNSEFSQTYENFNKNKNSDLLLTTLNNFVESETLSSLSVKIPEWKTLTQMSVRPFVTLHHQVQMIVSVIKLQTVHRWHPTRMSQSTSHGRKVSESEIVNLLCRIEQEMEICLRQTSATLQIRQTMQREKQLRSRQRDNLQSLIAFLPDLSVMTSYIITLSSWIYCQLDHYDSLNSTAAKRLQRYLKSCLQTCENIRTFTSSDCCKWSLAGESILKVIKGAENFAQQKMFTL